MGDQGELGAAYLEAWKAANPGGRVPEISYSGGWYRISGSPRAFRPVEILTATNRLKDRAERMGAQTDG